MLRRRTSNRDHDRTALQTRRDAGMSFIEVLVSIVLLGTVVIGVLTAVRATVIATTTEREHSRAGQWLESAAKVIEGVPFGNCSVVSGVPQSSVDALAEYNDALQDLPVPAGWSANQLSIQRSADIDVWDGTNWVPYSATSACYDDTDLRLQRVLLTVESPDGRIIETLEVVKRG